jgi:predicted  nucleic acid-binding Zn-ribbon protein
MYYDSPSCYPEIGKDKKSKLQKKTDNLRKQYYKLCDMRSFLQLKRDMLWVKGDIKNLQKTLKKSGKINEGSGGIKKLLKKGVTGVRKSHKEKESNTRSREKSLTWNARQSHDNMRGVKRKGTGVSPEAYSSKSGHPESRRADQKKRNHMFLRRKLK